MRIARAEQADVVLMDLQMPGGSGLAATRALAGPGVERPIRVVVLTAHASHHWVMEALEAGAFSYLLKTQDTRGVLAAIREAARGQSRLLSGPVTGPVIQELIARRLANAVEGDPAVDVLTPAEIAVVHHLSKGNSSSDDIAAALFISVNTVRSHLQSALRKTGFADRTQLALWGVRRGLDLQLPSEPSGE